MFFIIISGTGWAIDFCGYTILIYLFKLDVIHSNILSAIPSVTFVFFISTKKIFQNNTKRISLKKKYLIYVIYQIVLVLSVSLLAQIIYNYIMTINMNTYYLNKHLKILIKLGITPITMLLNFIFMKVLSEKY